jgi:uncharacterized repeat protein (TIGR01451 family)
MKRKNLLTTQWICAILVIGSMVLMSSKSFAVTRAMTDITNTASVAYKNQGGTGSYSASDTKHLTVAYKVVINLVNATVQTPTISATDVTVPLSITNSGNFTDNFDITCAGMFKDANKNHLQDAGENFMASPWTVTYNGTQIQGGTAVQTGDLADGTSAYVNNVVVSLPNIADYNDDYVVVLQVRSKEVENTPAGLHIVNPGRTETWLLPIEIRKPHLVLTVTPPAGTSKVPGTVVHYTVNVANDGPIALASGTITFPLNSTYTTGTATQTFTLTNLAASANVDNTVTATIERTSNNGTGPVNGQSVSIAKAGITVAHSFFGYSITENPSVDAVFSVDRARGVSITEYTPKSLEGEPDVVSSYYFKVKNEGNANATASETDLFHFVKSQTAGTSTYTPNMSETYTYAIATGDPSTPGDPSTAAYSPAIGSGVSFDQSTNGISGGVERWVRVNVSVPADAQDNESRTFTFQLDNVDKLTGNPVLNIATYYTSSAVTDYVLLVKAPKLTITLTHESITSPVGNLNVNAPYPGDDITFLIHVHNAGTKLAKNVIVTQAVPASMTFVSMFSSDPLKGIMIGSTEYTNADDADAAGLIGTTVTTKPFDLIVGGDTDIRFKARVN